MSVELPEIFFLKPDVETIFNQCLEKIENELQVKVAPASPVYVLLKTLVNIIIQQQTLIDKTAKQNLLAYAEKENLDHLGLLVGCERLPASNAVTTLQINLSQARAVSTVIPAGFRVTAGDGIFFATTEDLIFTAGEVSKTVKAQCTVEGEVGNGYAAGELCRIVDILAFVESAENITISEGGADVESDDSFRERIRLAPESYSVAGSRGAYIYFTKQASSLINSVSVEMHTPGVVTIRPLLTGGVLPEQELLLLIQNHLSDDNIRPLTDNIEVLQPLVENFNIDIDYFVSRENSATASAISTAAEAAVDDFILWQKSELGRDINPSELIYRLKKAGVKRVVLRNPTFQSIDGETVAICNNVNINFAGLEDD